MEATTGTNGNATLSGGDSADKLIGGSGSDTMDGGAGSDLLNAGAGDDLLRYKLSDITTTAAQDIYIGGSGKDTLEVVLTTEQWANSDVRTQLFNYLQHLKNVTNSTTGEVSSAKASDFKFTFYGSTLTVQMVERLKVVTKEGLVLLDSTKEVVASGVALSGADVTGKEDTPISLSGISAQLIDNDGSETMTLYVEGVPDGAKLTSAGITLVPTSVGGKTLYQLTSAQLQTLKITPPSDSDKDFTLTFTAFTTESNGGLKSNESTLAVKVNVNAVADTPTLGVVNTEVSVDEDGSVGLGKITAAKRWPFT